MQNLCGRRSAAPTITQKKLRINGALNLGDDMRFLWKRRLLHLFFPTRCPVCGALIGAMERFCAECTAKLSIYSGSFNIEGAESFTAAFDYDENVKPAIILLKNGTDGNAAYALGEALAERLKSDKIADKADVIIPAPMHKRDIRRRGFNQSVLIAREAGRVLGLPVDTKSVVKSRHTHSQKELSRVSRALNLKSAFTASADIKGKNVLLIDDICTTGSTLREITSALKKAGAAKVYCACCCKTRSRKYESDVKMKQ